MSQLALWGFAPAPAARPLARSRPICGPRRRPGVVHCKLERAPSRWAPDQDVDRAPTVAPLTGFQATALAIFGGLLLAVTRQREAFHVLVRPLEAWAPRWLSPLAQAVALYVREGLMYWAAAGMALLSSFGIWRVVDQRAALLGRPPSKEQAPGSAAGQAHALPPPPSAEEERAQREQVQRDAEEMRRLRFQLQQAQQEVREARHRIKSLTFQGGAEQLAARVQEREGEMRVVRMEAETAKEELARTQREVQELTGLVSATLASLSLDGEEVGAGGEEEQQEQEEGALGGGSGGEIEAAVGEERGGTGLLAAAGVLRSKVVLLAKKAAAAGEVASQVAEVKRLQDELRRADMTIASLNSELSTLKWEGQHARYAMDALERHLNGSRKENASLQRAAAKAERHLDAYDRMVLRLEDRVEELEEEREHLQAKLGALQAQAGAGAGLNGVGPLGAKPSAA